MATASEQFAVLGQKVDQAQQSLKAAAAEDKQQLSARVDVARKSADEQAAKLRASAQEQSDEAKGKVSELQQKWSEHIADVRQRVHDRKAKRGARMADHDAEWAERYALDAIDVAVAAIEEAEYAVLDAALARQDADALAGATQS